MEKRDTITEIFGVNVFNDEAMQVYLPKAVFKKLKKDYRRRSGTG